ncbi:hypothetical protein EUGRSUZ_K01524 [Eucalyptus grandis]|uniref:Uncharacterized protein n=2 Tax=Eucalyptus grandis TaxID=71139 RepID=A0ACC3IWH5_EUCGR|nr:hypothetical protein EUGRSUZ_K01524 [Eucalyptus grandis]
MFGSLIFSFVVLEEFAFDLYTFFGKNIIFIIFSYGFRPTKPPNKNDIFSLSLLASSSSFVSKSSFHTLTSEPAN